MSESDNNSLKKKRLKGLGGALWKRLEPLNENEDFKERFRDEKITIVLNATDQKYAAVLKIDHGTIDVENVDNSQNLKKLFKSEGWDAMMQTTTKVFFDIVAGKISQRGIVGRVLSKEIEVKNQKKLRVLRELFTILRGEPEEIEDEDLRILSNREALAYNLPILGYTAIVSILTNFTLLFYINILGQPPIVIGLVFAISLFVFAIASPIWGAMIDRMSSKYGPKKLMILISGPILAILFILLWYPPIPPSDLSFGTLYLPLIIWFLVLLLSIRVLSAAYIPSRLALFKEVSNDEKNRIKISMMGNLVRIIGTAIAMLGPIFILANATRNLSRDDPKLYYHESNVGKNVLEGILFFGTLVGIIFIIAIIIMFIVIKEPYKEKEEKSTVFQSLKELSIPLKDKNNRIWLISIFIIIIPLVSGQFLSLNMGIYLLELRGNELVVFALVALFSACSSFIFWLKAAPKLGLKKTLSLCSTVAGINAFLMSLLVFPLEHGLVFLFGLILFGIRMACLIGILVFPVVITMKLIDQAELETGKSLGGSYSGLLTMVTTLGSAIGMILISLFLNILGPENKISYAFIAAFGGVLLFLGTLIFLKVDLTGTKRRDDNK